MRVAQNGQIVPLFAVGLGVLALLAGIGVDGGMAFFESRQTQNAADLSSQAAAELLALPCTGAGPAVTGAQVSDEIASVVAANDSEGALSRTSTADYLSASDQVLGAVSTSGNPPSGACEIELTVSATWPSGLLAVIHQTMSGSSTATSGYEASGQGRLLS